MTPLSDAEKQILVVVQRAIRAEWEPHQENLLSIAKAKLGRFCLDWTGGFDTLIERGLIDKQGELYHLTNEGKAAAREVAKYRPIAYYWYNEYYLRAESSQAHGEFLRRVYGRDLCQHGIMDMAQLDKLIEVLDVDETDNILELGCGNGMITEYISDQTGARITGMDIADNAIKCANVRTRGKRDRLIFDVGSMYSLDYPEASFDAIVSIDTLYFVSDIHTTMEQVARILRPGGQMGVFFGTLIIGADSAEDLLPDNTSLAKALKKLGLTYDTIDYTDADRKHWELKEKVLEEMKPLFEAEDNLFLWDNRMAECKSIPQNEPGRRYLYHVRKH